ncbi:MAG: DUF1345 domain-containing protein [Tabrizicola flagellatus]|uniref:DUF1345 domain-containing protein n=1 Tax=Tabrizicola flagellatus TaxID=2593021 RepID=UPI00391B106E
MPHPRFVVFLLVFLCTTVGATLFLPIEEATILGFDLAAAVFIALAVPLWTKDVPEGARARAARDDGGRVLLILTAAAALAAILLALGRMVEGRSHLTTGDFAIVAGTLVLAWLFSNLVYAFHYAHLYYDQIEAGDAGGIIFPEGGEPVFADFVYFAFVIGMTCQTADLDIASRPIRRVVTLHGLFAFFFNLGVLALTINVLSGVL